MDSADDIAPLSPTLIGITAGGQRPKNGKIGAYLNPRKRKLIIRSACLPLRPCMLADIPTLMRIFNFRNEKYPGLPRGQKGAFSLLAIPSK